MIHTVKRLHQVTKNTRNIHFLVLLFKNKIFEAYMTYCQLTSLPEIHIAEEPVNDVIENVDLFFEV
jgi:hypothetical protein